MFYRAELKAHEHSPLIIAYPPPINAPVINKNLPQAMLDMVHSVCVVCVTINSGVYNGDERADLKSSVSLPDLAQTPPNGLDRSRGGLCNQQFG